MKDFLKEYWFHISLLILGIISLIFVYGMWLINREVIVMNNTLILNDIKECPKDAITKQYTNKVNLWQP